MRVKVRHLQVFTILQAGNEQMATRQPPDLSKSPSALRSSRSICQLMLGMQMLLVHFLERIRRDAVDTIGIKAVIVRIKDPYSIKRQGTLEFNSRVGKVCRQALLYITY